MYILYGVYFKAPVSEDLIDTVDLSEENSSEPGTVLLVNLLTYLVIHLPTYLLLYATSQ